MNVNKDKIDLDRALTELLDKYSIKPSMPFHLYDDGNKDDIIMLPGYHFQDPVLKFNQIPLLTWRLRRKFVELKKIIDDAVIENVCLFRFCCLGSKDEWSLAALLYQEMDLFEFIGNGNIVSVHAVISDDQSGNIIVRLDNNSLCSIELNIQMPAGTTLIERHEIIAQKGVASDLVVDTQIPQSSIYMYTTDGENRYTDIDMELYGFDALKVDHIRSAFQVLKRPGLIEEFKRQHEHLITLVRMAFESDKKREKIILNSGGEK